MKKILLLIVSACAFITASAQNEGPDYRTAIGLKYFPAGVTIKHFIGRKVALEGIGYLGKDGFRLTALAEFYSKLGNVRGLNWYAGPGVHAGFRSDHWKESHPNATNNLAIGVDGIVGIDYKFRGIPLNLSIDWQPSYNLSGENYFEARWGGIGIRYAF
ncbi:MAG: hypothetical protein EOO15_19190 [Chitinophagaceae bacterium]|nr:MAG: hypothetical protein EOO15_19190 [Chitinophagaceae bacterium]